MEMKRVEKKVVLAYSGGVDTTACIPYLRHEMGCDTVIALTVDLGQGDDLEAIRQKALKAGADVAIVLDVRERFVTQYGFPALMANAVYDGKYPLSSALGRPLIGEMLVETAHRYHCQYVAHGCTAKGNDQVRLDLAVQLLDPALQILAPAREWSFTRSQTVGYSEKFGIEPHVTKEKPWAIDLNILGRNVEAGLIEDLTWEHTEEVWALTRSPEEAPEVPEYVTIGFAGGIPVSLDGERMQPVDLLTKLNEIGGRNAIGRIDMLENRVVGIKSRELYEAPGQMLALHAHRELESLTLPGDLASYKRGVEEMYSRLVYNGLWHSPLKQAIDAFMRKTQERVQGEITLKLYKGNIIVASRKSDSSLYRLDLVTYGPGCTFNRNSAPGFIELFGLPSRIWSEAKSAPLSVEPAAISLP